MIQEVLQRRVLGAVRFTDITTNAPVRHSLTVTAEKLTFVRNLTGDYVITNAADGDLALHVNSFRDVPAQPAVGGRSFNATVKDPSNVYLPRDFTVALPRDPDPNNTSTAGSLFQPIQVPMLSAPSRQIAPNWCVFRFAIQNAATSLPIARAGIRIVTGNPPAAVYGMTDVNGQAMVAVAAIPFFTVSADPQDSNPVASEQDATYDIFAHKLGGAAWPELIAAGDNNLVKSGPTGIKIAPGRLIRVPEVSIAIPNP
jgi:hypothetical protein